MGWGVLCSEPPPGGTVFSPGLSCCTDGTRATPGLTVGSGGGGTVTASFLRGSHVWSGVRQCPVTR